MQPARKKKGPGESFIVTSLDGATSGLTLRPFLWGATLVVAIAFIIVVGVLRMQRQPASAAPPATDTPINTTVPAGSTLSNP
jgi:hypothetical protein